MAERIVSPGVFTNEIDQSFLPAAVSEIGAALVGITNKGPAFVPTLVESFTDFELQFGGLNPDLYLPYTARSYLRNAGNCTVVRVLGSNGYTNTNAVVIEGAGTTAVVSTGSFAISSSFSYAHSGSKSVIFTQSISDATHPFAGNDFGFTGSDGNNYVFEPWTGSAFNDDGPGQFGIGTLASAASNYFGITTDAVYKSGTTYFWQIGGTVTESAVNLTHAINAGYSTHGISASIGSTVSVNAIAPAILNPNPVTPASYGYAIELTGSSGTGLNSKAITTTTVTAGGHGTTGYLTATSPTSSYLMNGGVNATDKTVYGAIFPTSSAGNFTSTTISGPGTIASASSFFLKWHGISTSVSPTMSLDPTAPNYIESVLGNKPASNASHPGYVYKLFKYDAKSLSADTRLGVDTVTTTFGGYSSAKTPYIMSQTGSNNLGTQLFKFETVSDGTSANTEVKIGILNIRKAGDIAGSDYGQFDVIVRKFTDTDKRAQVLETFAGCNLDPDSSNYVVRRIGDQKWSFDSTNKKVKIEGDYPNKSKYVRLSDINDDIKEGVLGVNLVPFGFKQYVYPFTTNGTDQNPVALPVRTNQSESGDYNSKLFHGLAFDSGSTDITLGSAYNSSILPYLSPTPTTTNPAQMTSSAFDLGKDCGVNLASDPLKFKKYIVGFQGGSDGFDETYFGGPSSDGKYHGLGKATAAENGNRAGTGDDITAFKNGIATISNPDEVDINMLVLPGINSSDHSKIHVNARDTVEDRADAFYIFDAGNYNSTQADVVSQVSAEDSNYSATYWPWVKIFDDANNKHVWVPPSTVIPGVVAFTDKVAHPWFAPAGLNRGGLNDVTFAKERLTHAERDTLYEGRVNPIATFPGEGVCVWGQKTLQAKPSALDRVNVRRLLIRLKKFIASSSRFLVFEQNTESTRQRFLNIVNPFLETVQSNSGLSAFRVVMDDTNNTPDVVDRNQLVGQIFIQPTRTAEFIVLDFVVLPTGATFPE
tara:strand:- start:345 stop:3308 length:2964 start_codon:yes stop_codon:yes gene_type:complete